MTPTDDDMKEDDKACNDKQESNKKGDKQAEVKQSDDKQMDAKQTDNKQNATKQNDAKQGSSITKSQQSASKTREKHLGNKQRTSVDRVKDASLSRKDNHNAPNSHQSRKTSRSPAKYRTPRALSTNSADARRGSRDGDIREAFKRKVLASSPTEEDKTAEPLRKKDSRS